MSALRWVGWLLAAAAVVCVGGETLLFFRTGAYEVLTLGRIWSEVDRESLLRVQDALAMQMRGEIPARVFGGALSLPGWSLMGIPAVAVLWGAGPQGRKRAIHAEATVPAPPDP